MLCSGSRRGKWERESFGHPTETLSLASLAHLLMEMEELGGHEEERQSTKCVWRLGMLIKNGGDVRFPGRTMQRWPLEGSQLENSHRVKTRDSHQTMDSRGGD